MEAFINIQARLWNHQTLVILRHKENWIRFRHKNCMVRFSKKKFWLACCRQTMSLLILWDIRGRGCHIVYLGIKKHWWKGADIKSNEERRRNELIPWRCLDYNDLSEALSCLHFKLIFSFSAFHFLPFVCLFCQYVSLIYRFLLSAPLALHIPALTMNSQQRAKQPVTAEAAFI